MGMFSNDWVKILVFGFTAKIRMVLAIIASEAPARYSSGQFAKCFSEQNYFLCTEVHTKKSQKKPFSRQ